MTVVENRVVNMQFTNAQFEAAAKQTIATLTALQNSLKMTDATKGLEGINKAAENVKLGHISEGVDAIADRFKALSIIGITALTNIANKAINAGTTLLKSLTIDPIKSGFAEYETNLNSIQTIMANTGLEGEKGLKKVTDALDELNHYADQTIYNFSEMARNIGTFTAAGVTLGVATEAIKGIANLAAVSGSNAQQASAAMYQLSQAISAGKVSLEDWNSVVNAGMGGKVFQDALMETARVHGVAIDKMVKEEGSFRLTLQNGWLTSTILTETLSKFTGDLTRDQLKAMKYNDKQIEGILKMGKIAQDAATKVKTMSQLINTLQEAATSGWAQTWQMIFGDFNEAKTLWTSVNQVLGGFISESADARNKVIGDWVELGGRTSLIYSIKNAFEAVMSILTPIKQAFRQIFPATTGKDLYEITTAIRMFTEGLAIGGQTADKIHRIFAGLFALFAIGWDIIKAVVSTVFDLGSAAAAGSGGFLEFLATIGDFLVALRVAIQQGGVIQKVFKKIGDILKVPIQLLQMFGDAIGKAFDKIDVSDGIMWLTGLFGKLSPLANLGDAIFRNWQRVPTIFLEVIEKFSEFAGKVTGYFTQISTGAGEVTDKLDFTKIFAGAGVTGFIVALTTIWNLIRRFGGAGADIVESVRDSFDALSGSLNAMQNTLRAATLIQIAAAVVLLTVAVVQLSKIDAAGLTRALTAISVMFTQLFTSMAIFEKFMSVSDIAELIALGIGMIFLATAIDILASAVAKLAGLGWNELAQGLTGVTVLLGALVLAMKYMPNPAGLISTAAGLVVLAVAIKLLASSVEMLSGFSWEELAKGLIGVGTLLAALTLFTKFAGANGGGVLQGAGLLLLAGAIKILVGAVADFAEMSWMEIARGLVAMGGALAAVGLAISLIPPTAPLAAAGVAITAFALGLIADALDNFAEMSWMEIARGLTAMAVAIGVITVALLSMPPTILVTSLGIANIAGGLLVLAQALQQMGDMSWSEIGRAVTVLVASLLIIAAGMTAIQGALLAAPALLIVATSLAILAPVLLLFGQMSWEEIGKGLLMLAGALTVIGLAGLILQPVIPSLIGLGVAITLLGVGMLAAGAGVLLMSVGLTALSVAGVAGTAALVGMVAALSGLIPVVMDNLARGLIAFATTIATAVPAFTDAIVAVLTAILNAIIELTPLIITTFFKLLNMLMNAIETNMPVIQEKGVRILISFLEGIKRNIPSVVKTATDVIVAYINAIAANLPKVIDAGVKMIIAFINGLANAIRDNQPAMESAGNNLGSAIISGIAKGIGNGLSKVRDAAVNVAKSALSSAMSALGIHSPSKEFMYLGEYSSEGLAIGLLKAADISDKAASDVGNSAIDSLKGSLAGMNDLITSDLNNTPVIRPVLDLTDIKKNAGQIDNFIATKPILLDTTYLRAREASAGYRANQDIVSQNDAANHSESITFNQTITSPKPVNAADVYRATKNQLAVAAKEVGN